jgi:hypothetical protein
MEFVALAVNALIVALLAATIIYCMRLDRRLWALRSGQDGLKDVIAALDRATERAQGSLAGLRTMGLSAESTLKLEIEKADGLLEELKLMVQSADRVADRLVQARPAASAAPAAQSLPQPKAASAKEGQQAPNFDALRQAR